MGFTRTSEGRVFFKGADNDDGPRYESPASTETALSTDQTQMQILLLLKSLNAKLKSSKEDQSAMKKQLIAYKETIKKIKEQTSDYESNYIDLEQKVALKQTEAQKQVSRVEETLKDTLKQLEEARLLVEELEAKEESRTESLESLKTEIEERKKEEERILKRQKDLEKAQSSQGEKMVDHVAAYVTLTKRVSESEARQASLHNKIEETTSEYLKLDRKIDKAVEDRNRILRKIERIEAAVMETRDALNAKAMVLLTQQGTTSSSLEYPQIAVHANDENNAAGIQSEKLPVWKKTVHLNTATLTGLVFAVLALGWLFSFLFTGSTAVQETDQPTHKLSLAEPPPQTSYTSTEPLPLKTELNPHFVKVAEDTAIATIEQPELPAVEKRTQERTTTVPPENDDYGITIHKRNRTSEEQGTRVNLNNEKQTLAMMENAPEKVAEELNKIEPATYTPPAQEISPEKPQAQKTEQQQTATEIEKPLTRMPAEKEAYKRALRTRIKSDPNLNDVARRIESQAFDGIPEAQHDMGAIYVSGHGAVKQDINRAVLWFEEASRNGIANAQYNLGVLYHQGMGVEKNLERVIQLYQKAADQGHPEAQYNLGIANIEGIGVPYNPQKAATYFENAANKNIMEAAYNLGLIYENGLLGETHPDEALMWYKTAADNGSPEAKSALEQLANSLGIALSDVNRVVEKTRLSKKSTADSTGQSSQQKITGEIQQELMDRGLYPGPVDGMNGPMTANAIRNFQTSENLTPDGIPSKDLLTYMRNSTN